MTPNGESRRDGGVPRILLVGTTGQLGSELARTLPGLGDVRPVTRDELDLADPAGIAPVVRRHRPDLIVNAAAYTAVDSAESDPATARAVNGIAPGRLAREVGRLGGAIVHFSTDYVFDGRKDGPYGETDEPAPLNVYGRSKLEGERRVRDSGAAFHTFRLGWVYGGDHGNFLATALRLLEEREELRMVVDQRGSPTWSRPIAAAVTRVLGAAAAHPDGIVAGVRARQGLYHLSAGGETTWYGFASAILEWVREFGTRGLATRRIRPIPTEAYPLPAARPTNSVLCNDRFRSRFGFSLPAWEEQLAECLSDLQRKKPGGGPPGLSLAGGSPRGAATPRTRALGSPDRPEFSGSGSAAR